MSSADSDSDDAGSAISALDSSVALILVHDQDEPPSQLDFTDDAGIPSANDPRRDIARKGNPISVISRLKKDHPFSSSGLISHALDHVV